MTPIIHAAVAVTGVGCLIWSVIAYFRISAFVRRSIAARGEVIALERTAGSGRWATYDYAPVFRFETANGESVTVTSDISSSPPSFTEGEAVSVLYDPSKPSDAKIHTFLQTWGGCAIPAAVGVIFPAVVVFQTSGAAR